MIRGKRIKKRREACGLTQAELAEKLFVSVQAVSQWENGKTQPDSDRILLLARALNTTTDALLDDEDKAAYDWPLGNRMFSEEHMYSKLKAFAQTESLTETYRALPYMRQRHDGQIRKPPNGSHQRIPYIVHPLTMACHAHAMGIRDDAVLAAALLHDVCEDCGVAPDDLPFSPDVRETVCLLTKQSARFQVIGEEAALVLLTDGSLS